MQQGGEELLFLTRLRGAIMWSTEKKNRLKLCYFWALLLSFQFAIEIQKLKEETKDDMNEWISDTDEWCNWSNKFNDGLLTQYTVHVLTHYNWKKNTTLSYSILYTIQGIPTISRWEPFMRKSPIRKIISSSIWREGRRCVCLLMQTSWVATWALRMTNGFHWYS